MMQIYDVDINNFEGTYQTWVNSLHPNFKETAINEFTECLESKGNLFESNFTIILSSGDEKHIGARAIIERDHKGNPIKVTGLNWDRTDEQRRIDKIEEQTRINQHQMKLASIGELAAGVGHEINNPLAIVKGYIGSIQNKIKDSETIEKTARYFDRIDIAVNRISEIVKGLRTFSRCDSIENETFDVISSIDESYELIREIYSKEDIEVTFNKDESDTILLHGNEGRFQQVLLNLLSNAKDAVKKVNGERKVSIDLQSLDQNTFTLKVSDNGIGIKDEIREQIFDPFFTTKGVNQGTGIGLSLVHATIQELGGKIEVQSEVGKGTCFICTLPISKEESLPQPISVEAVQKERSKNEINVLIIDDEEDIREIIRDMVEEHVSFVQEASNGQEALEIISKDPEKFQLVLTDFTMPEMNGLEVCEEITKLVKNNPPKFVLLTGGLKEEVQIDPNDPNNVLDGILYKPFEEEALAETIDSLLNKKTKTSIAG